MKKSKREKTMENKYDLIIIGGGAAAFSAAIKANAYGVKTAMIERGRLGGTCVNVGCVPSKNLLAAGEHLQSARKPAHPAIKPCDADFDFTRIIHDKDKLVGNLRKQKYNDVLESLQYVQLIEGSAAFVSKNQVKVDGKVLSGKKFIIATGSSAFVPKFKGIEDIDYLTNIEALSLKEKPSSMIVVGGRALGLEFAQMYSRFGTKVTLLQRSDRIIPEHEPEVSAALHRYLAEECIEIVTGVNVKEAWQKNGGKFIRASVDDKDRVFEADQLLMATGRKPNTADLHLENVGVKVRQDGAIVVNSEMRTSAPHIWAGGDVVGEPMLETLAAKEGATAAENALTGSHKKIDLLSVPSAIFTSPQVASVGMTEKQMMQRYGYCSCRTLDMDKVPKALTVNDTKGLIKMVVDPKKKNRIVGVHILSSIAADMIHEAVLAVKYKLTVDDIIDTVHVFPTMNEAIKLVATSFKQDVSKLSCCAE
ncbi:mercuric reductase [Candidatus Nitrososphaera gargensis Ga9.2]|uniref:Mercuric reductase n=2 Tax=Candidatus Nitrososphaera gargensis TaxID=497727 RepID=K0IGG9_NITGG|nr:mercuric reductase [Candidatus Nitrososphaera gargensis Ga9.2]